MLLWLIAAKCSYYNYLCTCFFCNPQCSCKYDHSYSNYMISGYSTCSFCPSFLNSGECSNIVPKCPTPERTPNATAMATPVRQRRYTERLRPPKVVLHENVPFLCD